MDLRTLRLSLTALALGSLAVGAEAATFLVTTTADGGPGSLRQAILDANGATDPVNEIDFAIPGPGPHVIQALSELPALDAANVVDVRGDTQPGADCSTWPPALEIVLDGRDLVPVGLRLASSRSTLVRGLVIQRFTDAGIRSSGNDDAIGCNFVGTDADGLAAAGNGVGVAVEAGAFTLVGTSTTPNLISANGTGIVIEPGSGGTVWANLVGTDVTGLAALPNTGDGIVVEAFSEVIENTVAGNGGDGIVFGAGGSETEFTIALTGNRIGVGADGSTPLGNAGHGIAVELVVAELRVAGGSPNVIAHNGGDGVRIVDAASLVEVQRNSIFANGGLAIDIGAVGPDAIDPGDGDGVPNPPIIEAAVLVGGSLRLIGYVDTLPATEVELEFFDNAACDASGFGEAETFLASDTVVTDGAGNAAFIVDTAPLPVDSVVTATATRAGETSEVSACAVVSPLGAAPPIEIPTLGPGGVGALTLFLLLAATYLLRRRRSALER